MNRLEDKTTPVVIDTKSTLMAQGNALLILCTLLVLAVCFLAWLAVSSANQRADEVKVAFVKLHPSGSYNVSFYDSEQPFSLFQNTIDHLLKQAITRRFRKDPLTIQSDYNYFALFLGDAELTKFLREYRAGAAVREYLDCVECPIVKPVFRAVHHQDRDNINLADISAGVIVRSNLFLDLEIRNRSTSALIRVESKIIPMQWTLDINKINPSSEIDGLAMVILNENPIGLTILEYNVENDLSDTGVNGRE